MPANAADAMQYVTESLNGEATIQDRLLCVSRLRVVALALGEEKTRSELLPFLRKLRDPPVRPPVRCFERRQRQQQRTPLTCLPIYASAAATP